MQNALGTGLIFLSHFLNHILALPSTIHIPCAMPAISLFPSFPPIFPIIPIFLDSKILVW